MWIKGIVLWQIPDLSTHTFTQGKQGQVAAYKKYIIEKGTKAGMVIPDLSAKASHYPKIPYLSAKASCYPHPTLSCFNRTLRWHYWQLALSI